MRFADITGQEDLKRHLVQSVDAGRISHAQLFTGQAGAGALALAVAYVQYLCCRHRRGGDSCGECPDCKQIAALAHPDLHLVFPVNKQGKKSGEVMCSDEFLPLFRGLFAERGHHFHAFDSRVGVGNQRFDFAFCGVDELAHCGAFSLVERGNELHQSRKLPVRTRDCRAYVCDFRFCFCGGQRRFRLRQNFVDFVFHKLIFSASEKFCANACKLAVNSISSAEFGKHFLSA